MLKNVVGIMKDVGLLVVFTFFQPDTLPVAGRYKILSHAFFH